MFKSAETAIEKGHSDLSVSPKPTSKPRRTFVDAALALDEVPQRLIQVLVFRRVPQHTGPFASRALIDLVTICRTINYGRERFRLL